MSRPDNVCRGGGTVRRLEQAAAASPAHLPDESGNAPCERKAPSIKAGELYRPPTRRVNHDFAASISTPDFGTQGVPEGRAIPARGGSRGCARTTTPYGVPTGTTHVPDVHRACPNECVAPEGTPIPSLLPLSRGFRRGLEWSAPDGAATHQHLAERSDRSRERLHHRVDSADRRVVGARPS